MANINRKTIFKPSGSSENPIIKDTFNVELVNKNGKKKDVKQAKEIYLIPPFCEPPKKDCGTFLNKFFGHTSLKPDTNDTIGQLVHSVHVHKPNPLNCNSILCSHCNFEHDFKGNLILDSSGSPKPYGAYLKTIRSHSHKLLKFQEYTKKIIDKDFPRNLEELRTFFFSQHQTNHAKSNVFYTLVDKNLGEKQRKNLLNTLFYASKTHRPLNIYHIVVAPKNVTLETDLDVKNNNQRVIEILRQIGCFGGYIYLHPYRVPSKFNDRDECTEGAHWHFVGFSHVMADVQREISNRENVIIKNIHYHNGIVDPVKNVPKTLEYILSHIGVMIFKERIDIDLKFGEKYRVFDISNFIEDFILPPNRETNFSSDPLPISSDNFTSSINLQKFLSSEKGKEFTLLRRSMQSKISEIKDRIEYSKSVKKMSKKGRTMVMRSFGILGNSKNFIWGYEKEIKKFYCNLCNENIPLTWVYVVSVFTGHDRPPPEIKDDDNKDSFDALDIYMHQVAEMEHNEHVKEFEDGVYNCIQENLHSFDLTPYGEEMETNDPLTADYVSKLFEYDKVVRTSYVHSSIISNYLTEVTPQTLEHYYGSEKMKGSYVYKVPFSMVRKERSWAKEMVRNYYKSIKIAPLKAR